MADKRDDAGELAEISPDQRRREATQDGAPAEVGEWYWVRRESPEEGDPREWFGCVVRVGTNYVKLRGPSRQPDSYHSERVHYDHFAERCRREPDPSGVISRAIAAEREVIAGAVLEIGAISSRLQLGTGSSESRELASYRGGTMDAYKGDLTRARDKGLPELKEKIEEASLAMKSWMQAESVSLAATMETYESSLAQIEKRISGVELYAGLVEECVLVRDGSPAPAETKLHLFQRRHYMDEECLANYCAGGMTFEHVEDFERWLLEDENLRRILPYPRCSVAFRVRRLEREDPDGGFESFVKLLFGGHKDEDMQTYLYLRNGGQVYRLCTSIDFGEKLFPDMDRQLLASGEKLYAVRPWSKVERLATEGEYLDTLRREEQCRRELDALPEDADSPTRWQIESKYRTRHDSEHYVPWDRSSVYRDDVTDFVKQQMEDHNRLVLLLQGLYDRSGAFAPHPQYKLWDPSDFGRAIELVFDDSRALPAAELPDFESYRARLNSHMRAGSMAVGQEEAWLAREAARYNQKIDREFRGAERAYAKRKRYRPYGNPGPGVVAPVTSMSKGRCTFEWRRQTERGKYGYPGDKVVDDKITVPLSGLLCVDAYRPGDYKKFYSDPRTRAEYLRWAPLLLRAEEWHTGLHRK